MAGKNTNKKQKMTFAKDSTQAIIGIIVFIAFIIKVSFSTYGYFMDADISGRINIGITYALAWIVTIIGLTVGIKTCIRNAQDAKSLR